MRIHLAAGILERDGRLLLVASRYPNQAEPLWNLPGGRQRDDELLHETLRREFAEETGLEVAVRELRYLSESYDRTTATHFLCTAFTVSGQGEPRAPEGDAHVTAFAWVPREELARRIVVRVVREPLLAHLADEDRRYFAFDDAGITIRFADPA